MPRIVSLLPCSTEMVAALGAGSELVGVSHECDWPPEVARRVASGELPVLSSARIGPPLASSEIDRAVKQAAADAISVYSVDQQALAALEPDIVITQDLCKVCAVSYEDLCEVFASQAGSSAELLTLHPRRLADVWNDIHRVAAAIGRAEAAEGVVSGLQARLDEVRRRTAAVSERPSVISLEWTDPPMFGGLWMAELIENAGGIALGSEPGVMSQSFSIEQMEEFQPDMLLVKPCGYKLDKGIGEIPALMQNIPWLSWPACRNGAVYICDGHYYFNRPGPRIVDSQEILAAMLWPQLFPEFVERYRESSVRVGADGQWETWR